MLVLLIWGVSRVWLGTGACIWRSIVNCMSSQVYGYRGQVVINLYYILDKRLLVYQSCFLEKTFLYSFLCSDNVLFAIFPLIWLYKHHVENKFFN